MEARLLGDHDAIDIDDSIAGIVQHGDRSLEHAEARCIFELRIVRWRGRADITQAACAEERIDHCVRDHVSVGIAVHAGRMLDSLATQYERMPRYQHFDAAADA